MIPALTFAAGVLALAVFMFAGLPSTLRGVWRSL